MIPNNQLTPTPLPTAFIDGAGTLTGPLVDTEMGGVGLNNPSQGSQVQMWDIKYVGNDVIVSAPNTADTVLFIYAGITELSLAFDQNMNPFVAFTDAIGSRYWWYDSVAGGYVFSAYLPSTVKNLRCTLDDKRSQITGSDDIILAYMNGTSLCYRQQRDRFATEYVLKTNAGSALFAVGMNVNYRLQFVLHPL